jgi:hypothetical protein
MKARDIAEQLMKHPDFDVKLRLDDSNGGWPSFIDLEIEGVIDVGHSDQIQLIGAVLKSK